MTTYDEADDARAAARAAASSYRVSCELRTLGEGVWWRAYGTRDEAWVEGFEAGWDAARALMVSRAELLAEPLSADEWAIFDRLLGRAREA